MKCCPKPASRWKLFRPTSRSPHNRTLGLPVPPAIIHSRNSSESAYVIRLPFVITVWQISSKSLLILVVMIISIIRYADFQGSFIDYIAIMSQFYLIEMSQIANTRDLLLIRVGEARSAGDRRPEPNKVQGIIIECPRFLKSVRRYSVEFVSL